MQKVYRNPQYYEIAFVFRDIPAEVIVFEAVIGQHSRIPVARMLELGCGPAPHLEELSLRGYNDSPSVRTESCKTTKGGITVKTTHKHLERLTEGEFDCFSEDKVSYHMAKACKRP